MSHYPSPAHVQTLGEYLAQHGGEGVDFRLRDEDLDRLVETSFVTESSAVTGRLFVSVGGGHAIVAFRWVEAHEDPFNEYRPALRYTHRRPAYLVAVDRTSSTAAHLAVVQSG